ncbi:UDP-N-acetylmuramoyl-L-alanyl-D-glutamate--2,6-diaminopimelate ligase [Candidatus Planktophila lacus]|uniref:UDP-N-acetylmuramoyl-L-alanyl-D-glutamate--2, 6-diaminopimelate ligase n=1 Tax=Candidatus Planktophila lacus TaxID=1884913 RepID=UPI000BAC9C89|nr:UDP-N-acetylmuramoyl-L-alanyl-D-glutamate--2,6-diaminopimelate ligase [Candidatus Planktophila lacus]
MRPFSQSTLKLTKVAGAVSATCELSEAELSKIEISGLTHNDSQVEPGDLFIAIPGANRHGAEFAMSAVSKGAVAILTDSAGAAYVQGIPVLVVADPRRVAGNIAALFYNEPMRDLSSIGITGTNGKTTVSTLIYQIFEAAGRDSGLIGTIETRIGKDAIDSSRTTPEATDLQALSAVMRERHMRHLVMEVSSHAMVLHRMQGAHFAFVGFTNLTQDHLDFHGDIESYFAAKAKLFTYEFADQAVINIDTEYGARLADKTELPVISLSRLNPQATWHFTDIDTSGKQVHFKIRGSGGMLIESSTKLRGGYNLDNLLMAIAIAVESGVDPIDIAAAVPALSGAAGRLEEVSVGQSYSAFVDYAHTPDAVSNVLESIREFTSGKVIAVLGCGGDRDSSKRPLMGQALLKGCDIAVFTSDNPRSEDPSQILKEMVGNLKVSAPAIVIEDRKSAIEYAVSLASQGDTIAILGKGHELGQEIAGQKLDFDDRKVLAQAIAGVK